MKKKLPKILILSFSLIFLLAASILPALAFTVSIRVQYLGTGGFSDGLQFKTDGDSTFYTVAEGNDLIAIADYMVTCKITLNQTGTNYGYTGFLLYLTESQYYTATQNLVPTLISDDDSNLVTLADGNIYIASGSLFYFTKNVDYCYLTAIPINYDWYISNAIQSQYDAGYQKGKAEQQSRINELESTLQTLMNQDTSQAERVQAAYLEGYRKSESQYNYVGKVFTTTVDGTSSIVQQMLNLEILGIKVYQFALLACVIPLTIFLVKVCIHH